MKKIVGAFFAACVGLAMLSHSHAQISLPWPGPGITVSPPGANNCTVSGNNSISTVGGTLTYVFTSSGTLTCPSGRTVNLLVVAGGGSGGATYAGGGGAGEVVTFNGYSLPSGATTITVGAGGAPVGTAAVIGNNGGDSTIGTCTAKGGGAGARDGNVGGVGSGGSGGGAGNGTGTGGTSIAGANCAGGTGRGTAGGGTGTTGGGGGGGATTAGSAATTANGALGGAGFVSSITGFSVQYGCGGGGAGRTDSSGAQGPGGCSTAGTGASGAATFPATAGQPNTGSGGGGGNTTTQSGAGGSGIVVVQDSTTGQVAGVTALCSTTGTATPAIGRAGTNTTYTFASSGSITCPQSLQVNYVLVGGGGGSAGSLNCAGGGGGAGGVRSGIVQLNANQTYQVTIGAGGTGVTSTTAPGNPGQPSLFDSIATAFGGGGGAGQATSGLQGRGASSGGNTYSSSTVIPGIAGQGNSGGIGGTACWGGGGGGGATGVGTPGNASSAAAGQSGYGGSGYLINPAIFGVPAGGCVAGGGAGGRSQATGIFVGTAPCGGGIAGQSGAITGGNAAPNSGSGGGGAGTTTSADAGLGGTGGSGLLVISHPTTQPATICTANTDNGGSDANVRALWHFDQTTNDTSTPGSVGTSPGTLTGAAVSLSAAQSKFGGYAIVNGNAAAADMLVNHPAALTLGTGDITYEWWGNLNTGAAAAGACAACSLSETSLYWSGAGTWTWNLNGGAVGNWTTTPPSGTWQHYAVVRSGTTASFYLNGNKITPDVTNSVNMAQNANLGIAGRGDAAIGWGGYIDEFRISNFARYSGTTITPPSAPFCDPVPASIGAPTLFANSGQLTQTGSSITTTTTAPIVAGNLAVIAFGANTTTSQLPTAVSDGVNNYTLATRAVQTANQIYTDIWYAPNAQARPSGSTITITLPAAGGTSFWNIFGAQVSGAGVFDRSATIVGAPQTSIAVPIAALATAPEIGFCLARSNNAPAGSSISIPDPAWTNLFTGLQTGTQNQVASFDYRAVTNPTAINYQPTYSASMPQVAHACATFIGKPASGPVLAGIGGTTSFSNFSIPNVNIPAGSTILVPIVTTSGSAAGSVTGVSDGTNTYTQIATTWVSGSMQYQAVWQTRTTAALNNATINITVGGGSGALPSSAMAIYLPTSVGTIDNNAQIAVAGAPTAVTLTPNSSPTTAFAFNTGYWTTTLTTPNPDAANGWRQLFSDGGRFQGSGTGSVMNVMWQSLASAAAITSLPTWPSAPTVASTFVVTVKP